MPKQRSALIEQMRQRFLGSAASTIAYTVLCLSVLLVPSTSEGGGTHVLKISTLAPEGSAWMNAMNAMNEEIVKATGGRVKFKFYPGGILGDEGDMLRKIRIKQIHGGLFAGTGLGIINPKILVMEVPFLFDSYEEVDSVMSEMEAFFRRGLEEKGFVSLGWAESGFVYLLSNAPLVHLNRLKGLKVWIWGDAPVTQAVFKEIGLTGVPLGVPDVLIALQTKLLDVAYASPLAAIALQWFTQIKYVTDVPLAYSVGGFVVNSATFNRIPYPLRLEVKKIMTRHFSRLRRKTRQDNAEALDIMKQEGIQVLKPMQSEVSEFRKHVHAAMNKLGDRGFSHNTLLRVMEIIEKQRATSQ